jgi:hypothetical protein
LRFTYPTVRPLVLFLYLTLGTQAVKSIKQPPSTVIPHKTNQREAWRVSLVKIARSKRTYNNALSNNTRNWKITRPCMNSSEEKFFPT